MIVWKHHIAEDYEKNGVPTLGNGVGVGGTVFLDFNRMVDWLKQNDKRAFYVAPIDMNVSELEFNQPETFMADSRVKKISVGPFAPIAEWQNKRSNNWYRRYKTAQQNNLLSQIIAIKPQLAAAAQQVYSEWEQDEEGFDEMLGTGGICQDIAEAMVDVIYQNIPDAEVRIVDNNGVGEQHVWLVAYRNYGNDQFEGCSVDIHPSVYETGGGYSWRKIPDVVFDVNDVSVLPAQTEEIPPDDY